MEAKRQQEDYSEIAFDKFSGIIRLWTIRSKTMKKLLLTLIVASVFAMRTQVESKDLVKPDLRCTTEASAKNLQDLMGVSAWNFQIHLSSLTNGFFINMETKKEGEPVKTILSKVLD